MIDFDWWEFHRVFFEKNVSRGRICNSCEALHIQRKGKDYATIITMWCTGGHKGRRQTNWLLFKTLPSLLLGIKPGKSKQLEERKKAISLWVGLCISAPRSQLCDFPFWTDSGEGVRKGWGGWGSISVAPCALYSIAHMCTRYGGAVYHITGNVAFSRLVLTYDKPGWARWSGGQENSTDFLFWCHKHCKNCHF